ncbi:type VI secretion system-associated protein TagO [Pelagibacterium montanilacus]|uniref:type VI secretion system-associated protein TagO n=1 Tax=Pelagibacterium montanilacus TaxID=2185280 RepID=UPI000F8C5C6D|nr:type VI secretion system-associated protein TagO [Pelagibacterium montanilacus]
MLKAGLLVALATLGLSAAAPALAQTVERCAAIGPASERLSCYDSLFRSDQFTGITGEASEPLAGLWTGGIEISQIEGTERPFATVQSEQLIPALPRGRAPARMTILCVDGDAAVQFAFAGYPMGTPTSNSGTLTIQFDRQPPRSQSLPLSPDRNALGFYDDQAARAFIEQLRQSGRLLVRAQPQSQRSVTVSFEIDGIEQAIAPVRESCNI